MKVRAVNFDRALTPEKLAMRMERSRVCVPAANFAQPLQMDTRHQRRRDADEIEKGRAYLSTWTGANPDPTRTEKNLYADSG
jgi:hypothetical protein